jgi:pimeloyl-ACP methyl ester carboxylesterase
MLSRDTIKLPGNRSQTVFRAGKGPLVVWLHGLHGVRDNDPVIARLAETNTVIALLAPGFNDVDELDALPTIHDLALHYDDVFEALWLDGATVIGHSFGAMIAAELAAHFPRRVKRLGLISPFGLWNDDHPVADLFATPYAAIDTILWKGGVASGPAMAVKPDPTNVETTVAAAQGMTAVAKFLWQIPDRGLRRRLYRVAAETIIVFGKDDGIVPAFYAGEFKSLIKGARQAVIPDAGHMVPYEKTDAVLAELRSIIGAEVAA